jgi:hypothetical protein
LPPPPSLCGDPIKTLVEGNRRGGITPDAGTATPNWQGEPLDLGLAMDMLWNPKSSPAGLP